MEINQLSTKFETDSLNVLYFIGWAASYLTIYRIVTIGQVIESSSVFFFPLSYALADVITEVYGYAVARQIIWSSLIAGFIFCTSLMLINNHTTAAPFWNLQPSYNVVLQPLLRAYFAISVASLAGSIINVYIISKWKIILKGKLFWLRSIFSTGIGELAFSIVVSPLCFVGVEPFSKMVLLITYGYLFKMLYAILALIPITYLAKMLKHIENVDTYDYGVSYNPFKFDTDKQNREKPQNK